MPAPRLQIAVLLALFGCKRVEREEKPVVDDWKDRYHEPAVLADKQPGPSDIAVDARHIYWTHFGKPLVRRMPRTGGAVETVYEGTGELGGLWLALDTDGVYFTEGGSS